MNKLSEIGLIRKISQRQDQDSKNERLYQLPSSFRDLIESTQGVLYADRNNVVKTLDFSPKVVREILRQDEKNYFNFEVPKRGTTETRTVSAPRPQLKELQKHMLDWLYENTEVAPEAHGFVRGRGNWTAAVDIALELGKAKKMQIFTQDLRKAFDSVSEAQVRSIYAKTGLKNFRLHYATRISTHNGKLATGAPTSPHLLNLLLKDIDHKLSGWAKSRGGIYRRYADDLTFAFPTWRKEVIKKAKAIMQREFKAIGIELHPKKHKRTRIGIDSPSAEVIGIAVRQNQATRPKRLRNRLRGKIRQAQKQIAKGNVEAALLFKRTVDGLVSYFTGEETVMKRARQERLLRLRFQKT
jgi:hypothetical protein